MRHDQHGRKRWEQLAKYLRPDDFSDAGNAKQFAEFARDRVLWCDSLGWLFWNEKKWETNEHKVTALAMEFTKSMLEDALALYKQEMITENDKVVVPDVVRKYLRHAEHSRNKRQIESLLTLARPYLRIEAKDLDGQWWELNTDGGIVDLRTGEIKKHTAQALHTKISPFTMSEKGKQEWSDFLNLVFNGDQELIRYKQMRTGMQIYGKVLVEDLEIDYGSGRNGKSTLNNAVFTVLGDYAGGIDSEVLTTDRQSKGAALATLRGKRLIVCGELEESQRLSISTMKRIASTDPMTIEAKYKNPETVTPSHHVILYSNFLPRVQSTDDGTWRRITLIPFQATMPKGKKEVLNYADVLVKRCGGAILQWMVDGAKMFCENGYHLETPQAVKDAVMSYKVSEDWLSAFIAERCLLDNPAARTRANELYGEYHLFAIQNGENPRRQNDFSRAMENAGFRKVKISGKPIYYGIRIDYSQKYGDPPPVDRYG